MNLGLKSEAWVKHVRQLLPTLAVSRLMKNILFQEKGMADHTFKNLKVFQVETNVTIIN